MSLSAHRTRLLEAAARTCARDWAKQQAASPVAPAIREDGDLPAQADFDYGLKRIGTSRRRMTMQEAGVFAMAFWECYESHPAVTGWVGDSERA
jgi:hypothetical protein